MEAKDLRITNLVKYKSFECAVTAIDLVDIRISRFKDEKKQSSVISIVNVYDDLIPIPLTEDRWIELGNLNKDMLVDKSGFVIFKNGYAYQFVFNDYPFMNQLQNLYFDLTRKELTITQ